ncbi:hypothetical protein ACMU_06260 [Actibacterium mucosum KCTC 23349]|uniref:Lipoprotein n=1 Tax=Actibacterium mucosum KCTC 23349 TaxID=1454373 RepID=A0A037ZP01_9RHOB|nr:lipoprotein [Actibacterium mucosum]KAJ56541.1 hypothetical protein ACMU_06260 [Actibacterium mucosum KCTC 23349]
MRIVSILTTAAFVGLTTLSANAAGHGAAVVVETESALGQILADANGMSLYTFDKDTSNVSNCNGDCAVSWPPLLAADSAHDNGKLTVIDRNDGSRQWAYDGEPLYFWVGDTAPGEVNGDGVGGVWHVAKP